MADEPAGFCCMCSINGLDDGIAAMTDLAGTGALAAELVALPVADLGPEQAARLVLALLGEAGALMSLVPGLGLPVHVAAGRMLKSAGMAVHAGRFRCSGSPPDLRTAVMVISPVARADVRISDDGTVRWECRFADPEGARGLTPVQAAAVAALESYRGPGPSQAHCGWPGGTKAQ
jgi:hypothetical protein